MNTLNSLVFALGGWANKLPAVWRKRFYRAVKVLAGLATVALLVLPHLSAAGVNLSDSQQWFAAFTAALALLGHLADRNTVVDPALSVAHAPEKTEPVNPSEPAATPAA